MASSYDMIRGYQILEFDDVELTKFKGEVGDNNPNKGTLKVCFFPDMQRFILVLNDIYYPLQQPLNITCSDKSEMKYRIYTLPLQDGCYSLKLHKTPGPEAIRNFETILAKNCNFSSGGEPYPIREGQMSSTMSTESSEHFPEGAEIKDPKAKKGMLAKAADTISKVFTGSSKNINMTTVRSIEELMNTKQDFLTSCEFPREMIEEALECSTKISGARGMGGMSSMSGVSGMGGVSGPSRSVHTETQTSSSQTTTIKKTAINYPREIIETEERLLDEIKRHREMQESEREKQRRHHEKEVGFVNKERALQDQLNDLRNRKMKIEVEQRETMYGKALVEKENYMQQCEERFARERQDFMNREKTLTNQINGRIKELKEKERLTKEEEAEFTRRERELIDLNKRLEGERVDMERRHDDLKKQAQVRETQIRDKERAIEAEKNEYRKREEKLRNTTEQRIRELQQKQKMTEEERVEFQRKQGELDKMNKELEREMAKIDQKHKQIEAEGERGLAELRRKEKLAESQQANLAQKEKAFEAECRRRIDELKKKEKLTEDEIRELQRREKELNQLAKQTEADQRELQRREQNFNEMIGKREAALLEKEKITQREAAELNDIKKKLQTNLKLTENEKRNLESMRDKIIKEAEKRQAELTQRVKMTEDERKNLQLKERDMEDKLQQRLAALRQKEKLTEEERMEFRQREEELSKMTRMREVESESSKKKLAEIRMREQELMAQNQRILQGHMEVQKDVTELQQNLEKPRVVTEQVESSKVRSSEGFTGERRQKTKEGKQEFVGSHQETTTSG